MRTRGFLALSTIVAVATGLGAGCAADDPVAEADASVLALPPLSSETAEGDRQVLAMHDDERERLGEAQEPVGPNGGREPLTLAGKICMMAVSYAMTFGCGAATKICQTDSTVDVNGIAVPCWIFQYIGCGTISGLSAIRAVTLCTQL